MIRVEGHLNLFRDEKSGAIVNMDTQGYTNYVRLRSERKRQREEIDNIKNDINEIKQLLKELINESKSQ
jgi:hypothetical protein